MCQGQSLPQSPSGYTWREEISAVVVIATHTSSEGISGVFVDGEVRGGYCLGLWPHLWILESTVLKLEVIHIIPSLVRLEGLESLPKGVIVVERAGPATAQTTMIREGQTPRMTGDNISQRLAYCRSPALLTWGQTCRAHAQQ